MVTFEIGDVFTLVRRETTETVSTYDLDALTAQRATVQARREAENQRWDVEMADIDALLAQCAALKVVSRAAGVVPDISVASVPIPIA